MGLWEGVRAFEVLEGGIGGDAFWFGDELEEGHVGK